MTRRPRKPNAPPPVIRAPLDAELLALDPGLLHPAAARFSGGKLVRAARTPVAAAWAKLGMAQRQLEVAQSIVDWQAAVNRELGLPPVTHVILEYPQVYREAKAKGVRPRDLLGILGVALATVGILAHRHHLTVYSPTPAEAWGQVPKCTDGDPRASVRGGRVWLRLDEAERAVIDLNHDSFDAAGLGLLALDRFERTRVFYGAT